MLEPQWNIALTALFAVTGIWCAWILLRRHDHAGHGTAAPTGGLSTATVIHAGHLVMSIAMIAMLWLPMLDVSTVAQIVVFGLFIVALGLAWPAESKQMRIDLAAHMGLHAAMIWMLWAMPLLMSGGGHGGGGGGGHEGHGGGGSEGGMEGMEMPPGTPLWADIVNWIFIALSAVAAGWWLFSAVKTRAWHQLCHVLMAVGMAAMLFLMNV